jgi:hypothetical protein
MIEDQHQSKEMPKEVYYKPHLDFSVGKTGRPLEIKKVFSLFQNFDDLFTSNYTK